MFKKEMGKAVRHILYAANETWTLVGNIDDTILLLHAAKYISLIYDLNEIEAVKNFENVLIDEYKEDKAKEAEKELRKRLNEGFVVEE